MNIHMTFKHMDATEALKTHVNDQSERIKKFVPMQSEATWTFYVDADVHTADLRVHGPHIDYFAQAKSPNLYQSIDQAIDKIERQLKKHKEIVKSHARKERAEKKKAFEDVDKSEEE